MRRLMVAMVVASALAGMNTADAQTYHITYSVDARVADEILTTSESANAAGLYTVTGLTGTFGGDAISLLAPGSFPPGANPNDNLFSPIDAYLDYDGLSFTTGQSNYNLYLDGDIRQCSIGCAASGVSVSNFAVSAMLGGAVPEPAAWSMMIVGFGLAGYAFRRRREVSSPIPSHA